MQGTHVPRSPYQGGFSMKCNVTGRRIFARLALGIAGVLPAAPLAMAQQGYVAPNFSQMGGRFHQASRIPAQMTPVHMASPLAGGPAAAMGDQFVDVHGNSIVMPAAFHGHHGFHGQAAQCPPGGAAMGVDPYGDPMGMGVDFGGYTQDQIGPHYYDVTFGAVFLTADSAFEGIGPLASVTAGPAAPRILDPADSLSDYEPGWHIGFRFDLGPLSVFEANYMGVYDFSFGDTVRSVDVTTNPPGQDFQLFSVFSNFGVPTPIDGIDDGSVYSINYDADLQSTELSYRRYWVSHNPRVSGTYLLGFRYVRMTEQFNFDIDALAGDSFMTWATANDVLGFQLGGDAWYGLLQGLRIGCEGKAGVYNNRFEFVGSGDFPGVGNSPADYAVIADGNQVAFVGEAGINFVADILPSWSLKGGYNILYIDNLATVAGNLDTTTFIPAAVNSENDALYHGFNASIEYVW